MSSTDSEKIARYQDCLSMRVGVFATSKPTNARSGVCKLGSLLEFTCIYKYFVATSTWLMASGASRRPAAWASVSEKDRNIKRLARKQQHSAQGESGVNHPFNPWACARRQTNWKLSQLTYTIVTTNEWTSTLNKETSTLNNSSSNTSADR